MHEGMMDSRREGEGAGPLSTRNNNHVPAVKAISIAKASDMQHATFTDRMEALFSALFSIPDCLWTQIAMLHLCSGAFGGFCRGMHSVP